MSERTNGDEGEPGPGPEGNQEEIQAQTAESVFPDLTAPVWAEPAATMSATPTPPGVTYPRDHQQPINPQATTEPSPAMSNSFAQRPPAQHWGQTQPAQQYPTYVHQPYTTSPHTEASSSAIVLTVLSGIVMLSTCFIIGIPSLIFGIIALTSNRTDPAGSRKQAKTGWILLAVNFGVVVLLVIAGFAVLISRSSTPSNTGFSV